MILIWLVLLALLIPGSALAAGDRLAIVIGNASYQQAPLVNPINDAREIAASLRDVGFQTELLEDASQAEMKGVLTSIRTKFTPGGVALLYFAGHALQHKGVNYLLPVDYTKVSAREGHRSVSTPTRDRRT